VLNATMNRHGERNGLAYLGLEVRQDLIDNAEGVAAWAARIKPIITACLDQLAASGEAKRL
jgi:predicted N-formylglutamate amidohydrolase